MPAYDPYALAFPAAPFTLTSGDFADGAPLPLACYAPERGDGLSPALSWSQLPENAESVILTAYDPDAPIPGGLWHWIVKDIPADAAGLAAGAGAVGGAVLPEGASHLLNDLGEMGYHGVNPPPGTGVHRLVLCATALSVPKLQVPEGASTALLHILMIEHTVGRAVLIGTSEASEVSTAGVVAA
ncbi:MAG TPA: YbhB/YbcL family Raf kinase inhibitor-like protein [Actinocrinis sp.]|nr:YbhB/YbcL family Raf kinase inhibitor-like protein [Actinocrinis sp.]